MSMMAQLTHRGLAQLAKHYGGLLHLKIGLLNMVVVSTPDVAREVLLPQDSVFSNRSSSTAIKYLSYDGADMAFANYGPFWRQMPFGSNSHEGEEGQIENILQEFSRLFVEFNIADFIPWLGWIHPKEFKKRLVNARRELDVFIDKVIDEHLAKKSNKNSKDENEAAVTDMVDELISFLDEGAHENKFTDSLSTVKLTRDNIKALIMSLGMDKRVELLEQSMSFLVSNQKQIIE
nr:cytochrome p450 84a1 [Quercus suber]